MTEGQVDYDSFQILERVGLSEFLKALDAIPIGTPNLEETLNRLKEQFQIDQSVLH